MDKKIFTLYWSFLSCLSRPIIIAGRIITFLKLDNFIAGNQGDKTLLSYEGHLESS